MAKRRCQISGRPARWLVCGVLFALVCGAPAAADSPSLEYQVKASYLFHFFQFVEWDTAPGQDGEPWVLCILGEDPFGIALDALDGETIRDRPIRVRRERRWDDLDACHVAFVGRDVDALDPGRLADLSEEPVLTVGETEDFLDRGGVIRFVIDDSRVRFRISPRAAEHPGMRIGPQLLRLGSR